MSKPGDKRRTTLTGTAEGQAGDAACEAPGLYRVLLDSMTEAVILMTDDRIIAYTNIAADRMFGYGPGELIGLNALVLNAYPPEQNDRIVDAVFEELERTGAWRGEWRNRRKDGSEFVTLARITAVTIDGRRYWLCVQEDVTDERAAIAALRDSETRLEIAAAAAEIGIWDWDLITNLFVYSARAKAICGFPQDREPTLEDIRGRVHPDDLPVTLALAGRALDPAVRDHTPYEYRIILPDGSVRWVLALGEAQFAEIDGVERAIRYVGTMQDVTERRRLEEAERAAARRLRLAIDAGHLAVWEYDLATATITGSPEMNRLLGFPEDAVPTADDIRAGYEPGDRERLEEIGWAALARGERFMEAEYRYHRPDGSVRWMSLRCETMLDDQGAPVKTFGVLSDITERKQSEEHQKLLVAELNHRVKNTLAAVQSIANQTLRDADPGPRSAFLGRLHALAQAHGLLSRTDWQGADLAEVMRVELLPHAGSSPDRISLDGPPVRVGPRAALTLGMAFHELATNAAKYGALSVGDGRVAVRWRLADAGGTRRLLVDWVESGGPPVEPPSREGFGTILIQRSIAHELDGTVQREFARDGFRCTMDVPLPDDAGGWGPVYAI